MRRGPARTGQLSCTGAHEAASHRGNRVRSKRVNEDRRCLVIDAQPTVRLGVREALANRYEVEEAEDGSGALELLTVDRRLRRRGRRLWAGKQQRRGRALWHRGDPARCARRSRASGSSPTARTPKSTPRPRRSRAGATAYVVKSSPVEALSEAVDAAAESERFVDPAASERARGPPGADSPPAPDPPALCGRAVDRARRAGGSG